MVLCLFIGFGSASTFSAQRLPKVHSTKDFTVVRQTGKNVCLRFNQEFESGTDSACERAEEIISEMTRKGYRISVANKGWFPTVDLAAFEARLDRLSDKK